MQKKRLKEQGKKPVGQKENKDDHFLIYGSFIQYSKITVWISVTAIKAIN